MAIIRQVKKRRSPHQTQWAAQFAVASELCKRGYEVALTMGNHPIVDLMVISPKGKPFLVDVKGLYKRNPWPVREKKKRHDKLFYVFAFVPNDTINRFFILSESQVNVGIRTDWDDAIQRRKAKGLSGEPGDLKGVQWNFAERYEDCWKALPK
jgi:hypothetical protein